MDGEADDQLRQPLVLSDDGSPLESPAVRFSRQLLRNVPPARAFTLLARRRYCGGSEERRVLSGLIAELLRRSPAETTRRVLYWVLGELRESLDDLAGVADAYQAAIAGWDDKEGWALTLACARARALCLSRLGLHQEAAGEYARYRWLAGRLPLLHRARMEKDLAQRQDDRWLFAQAAESWERAGQHYAACGRELEAATCLLEQGDDLMLLGKFALAARTMAQARRRFVLLGQADKVLKADRSLTELFAYWGRPRQALSAARRTYAGAVAQEEPLVAVHALENCAEAAHLLGKTEDRDRCFARASWVLAKAAREEEMLAQFYRERSACVRLDFVRCLAEDGRYREALAEALTATKELGSLRNVGEWRLAPCLWAVGRAREGLGLVPAGAIAHPRDSPPPEGYRLASVDNPGLLLCLGQSLRWN